MFKTQRMFTKAICVLGASAVLNIGLNYFLIQKMQAEGAAWATLITQSLMLVVQIAYVFFQFGCAKKYIDYEQLAREKANNYISKHSKLLAVD